jgi:hypothetical protein
MQWLTLLILRSKKSRLEPEKQKKSGAKIRGLALSS